jgi:glycosyltransferase involved in cell wall biosynthesis
MHSARSVELTVPRVTVVVGVYKHEPYVEACLDSILATGYPNLEIVIFNDASPDNSGAVVQGWIDRHPEVAVHSIVHEKNVGVTKSLGEAMRAVTSEYVCLIAADDVLLKNGISDRIDYLVRHPEKLAVFGDAHVIDESGRQIMSSMIEELCPWAGARKQHLAVDAILRYAVIFSWPFSGPCFAFNRRLLDVVGPYDETLLAEDWDMFIRASRMNVLGFLDAYVAQYRLQPNSLSSLNNRSDYRFRSSIQVIDKHLPHERGLIWARLHAIRWSLLFELERRPLRRRALWLFSRMLLAATNRSYVLFRRLVLSRPRSRQPARTPSTGLGL